MIINQTYSEAPAGQYIPDAIAFMSHDEDDGVVEGNIEGTIDDKIYINMQNEAGFVELNVNSNFNANKNNFIFVFDNTEIGSMSYIVVDNQTNSTGKNVFVGYGKTYSKEGDDRTEIIENEICEVENGEKAVIQVFHSLSMDIVVGINKL